MLDAIEICVDFVDRTELVVIKCPAIDARCARQLTFLCRTDTDRIHRRFLFGRMRGTAGGGLAQGDSQTQPKQCRKGGFPFQNSSHEIPRKVLAVHTDSLLFQRDPAAQSFGGPPT